MSQIFRSPNPWGWAARLSVAASLGLLACDRQPLSEPQNPYFVTLDQAQQVAEHLTNTNVSAGAGSLKTVDEHFVLTAQQQPALYVFNYKEGGFSIIPADRHLLPVLAYSTSSRYTTHNKPGGLLLWERKTAQTVVDAHAATTPLPSNDISAEWVAALNPAHLNRHPKGAASRPAPDPEPTPAYTQYVIGPYLPVTWGQGCSYNELFPSGSFCNPHTPTGCVMTAVAQVMAYYRFPSSYNWAAMPTNQGSAEVQRLMRDISLSLSRVVYQPNSTGAFIEDAAGGSNGSQGFRNSRFGYAAANYGGYSYATVINDLQSSRLPILAGYDVNNHTEGHAWVCDGREQTCYNDSGACYDRLHMNWGWHEQGSTNDFSGWFQYDNWNISGANFDFQYANTMVSGIRRY